MTTEAIARVAFMAKAPAGQNDLSRIMDLATRMLNRDLEKRSCEGLPDNVILFPGYEATGSCHCCSGQACQHAGA